VGLFGNRGDTQARVGAAEEEAVRLEALELPDLAVAVMPAFGADGMDLGPGHRSGAFEVTAWLVPDLPTGRRGPLLGAVIEALGMLEHANLLTSRSFGGRGSNSTSYQASRLGEAALADGSVRQQLGTTSQ
jgi:hypothetical protein